MVDIIFSSLVGDMASRMISALTGQFRKQSMESKLSTIHHLVTKIQSVIEDAEGRQICNNSLLNWLSELNNSAYQGWYVLDMLRYSAADGEEDVEDDGDNRNQSFAMSRFNHAKRLRLAVNTSKAILFRSSDTCELNCVLANLHKISEDLKEFILLLRSQPPMVDRPTTTSLYIDNRIFGRHVVREKIINFLLQEHNGPFEEALSILPIIGHTGVGKNTLVQLVCNDPRVRNYFPVILYYDFYFMNPTEDSISSTCYHPPRVLTEKFCGKRFLIVFKNIDFRHIQQLKALFPSLRSGKPGSKIIVTSNNRHVSSIGTAKPIILQVLPEAEFWFFFKAHAFGSTDLEENHKLMTIGKAIAQRLKGSFFGAKIVGGMLRANPSPKFWWKVMNSDVWKLPINGNGFAYVQNVTSHLLLPHVKKHYVAVTTALASNCITHPDVQSLCSAGQFVNNPDKRIMGDDGRVHNFDVLLCRSVFPLYTLYHIAHCTMQ